MQNNMHGRTGITASRVVHNSRDAGPELYRRIISRRSFAACYSVAV